MQVINIRIKSQKHKIVWSLSEHFIELKGRTFRLNKVSAEQIKRIGDLTVTAKILLSAVAGAVIQHLLDIGYESDDIFNYGEFEIV